jgi:hypothetical protein
MPNITVTVDQNVYSDARVFAARHNTSVSAIVQFCLQNLPNLRFGTEAVFVRSQPPGSESHRPRSGTGPPRRPHGRFSRRHNVRKIHPKLTPKNKTRETRSIRINALPALRSQFHCETANSRRSLASNSALRVN